MSLPFGELKPKQSTLDVVEQILANEMSSFGHVTQQLDVALLAAE